MSSKKNAPKSASKKTGPLVKQVTTKKGGRPPLAPAAMNGKKSAAAPAKPKKLSCINAAAMVLAKSGKPMRAAELIEQMRARGMWTSPQGKTPEASLYAAIIREIAAKGSAARFKKVERGLFAATGKA